MSFLELFPDRTALLGSYQGDNHDFPLKVNNHIHTPYSFSAFRNIEEAVLMASKEGVRILGINDFYVSDGYGEFIEVCRKYRIFPLLNIELIGISKADQARIFERFYRVSTGNLHEVKGFGLGLSYAKAIAEAHGGKISVQSQLGQGSTFELRLPCEPEATPLS